MFENRDAFNNRIKEINQYCGTGDTFITRSAFVMGASSCMAGGVQNGKEVVMYHDTHPYDRFGYQLMSNIVKIDTEKPVESGLLVGGFNDHYLAPAYKSLKRMFNDLNTKVTTFWAHKGEAYNTNLVYCNDKNEDTWYVNTLNRKYEDAINSVEDLKNAYEIIDILPEDEVYINGQKIDKSDLL